MKTIFKYIKLLFKYVVFMIIALVIAKWIIMFLPSNSVINSNKKEETTTINNNNINVKKPREVKEVELSINFKELEPQIEEQYQEAQQDIYNYIDEKIDRQKEESKYRLTEQDGFLDWIFGYSTGWKIMYKKVKGMFGSEDNEKKMIINKFQNDVINPGLNETLENINDYIKNRINDYYKNVITIDYINNNVKKLKEEGYTDIKIDDNSIPWASIATARGGDVVTLTEATGVTGMGIVIGKFVGSKVATIIGPKVLGLVEAKVATIVAGKIASIFELVLAPIIDYGANEAVKAAKYDTTKESFEKAIDNIFDEVEINLKNNADDNLLQVKNEIYNELNKQVKISAKEIK